MVVITKFEYAPDKFEFMQEHPKAIYVVFVLYTIRMLSAVN